MIGSRLSLGCLAACAAASALVPASGVARGLHLPSPDETVAVEVLDRAWEAAQSQTFEGVVTVEWRDERQRYSEQVSVSSAGGVLRFGDEVVGTGARRMVHDTDGWLSLWGHDVAALGPSPAAKYRLTVAPGPEVAGRPTDMVMVQLEEANRLRERLYVDRHSGLLLRRELLDPHGASYRSVAFTALSAAATIGVATAAGAPSAARSREPAPARHLKAPYKLKSRIGPGYRRVGAYKADGVVHQYFSDGLHGLSVFEQRGHLKAARTGLAGETGGGRSVEIAGRTMRAYSGAVGEAVVWESDGMVYTAVTDAPWSDLAGAVADLPHADPPGRLRRVAQAMVSLFRWK